MWRVTRYTMVLWGYPPHMAEDVLPRTIRLVDQLSGQPLAWSLTSQPGRHLPTTRAEWRALVEEYRARSGFSAVDMFLESSAGLDIELGVDAPAVVRDFDVLAIGFDPQHLDDSAGLLTFANLYALFVNSADLFQPFWAGVWDHELIITDMIQKLRFSVDPRKVPHTIHWFNYFDADMVERLGGKTRLLSAPAYSVAELESPPGVVIVLQREPFDFHNPTHRQRQEAAVKYLELGRLQERYPKKREVQLTQRSPLK